MKRAFDFLASAVGLMMLWPLFLIIALFISLNSNGGVFYKQIRVGRNNRDFGLYKFRTMRTGADKKGQLTVGAKDSRVTSVGYYLRKYKLDELPQLFNVLLGEMSLVGPRPEVRKYVEMYDADQMRVLSVRPGLTDYASLEYVNENDLLAKADDPEAFYIQEIMPAKLQLNMRYIEDQGIITDIKIILKTILKIVS